MERQFLRLDLEDLMGSGALLDGTELSCGFLHIESDGIFSTYRPERGEEPLFDMSIFKRGDLVLPFPFTLKQFQTLCTWHKLFRWEVIEAEFTDDDNSPDGAALVELYARNPAALMLARGVLGITDDEYLRALQCAIENSEAERAKVPKFKKEKTSDLEYWDEKLTALEDQLKILREAKRAQLQAMTPSPAPVVAVNACDGVEPDKTGPLPLTTNEIANCFAGFREWDVKRWKDELASPDKWLKACQYRKGTRGRSGFESTWSPVQIAVALVKQNSKSAPLLRARFKRTEKLRPWLDELEINIPDNSDRQ